MTILCCVLLGQGHPLVINFDQFLRDFIDRESMLFYYQPYSPGYALCMPILIIQWVTLRIDHYFRNQSITDAPVIAPNFGALFEDIELGRQWEPRLHTQVMTNYNPPPLPTVSIPPPVVAPAPIGGQTTLTPHLNDEIFRGRILFEFLLIIFSLMK